MDFSGEERVIYDITHSKDTENLKKTVDDLKKGHQQLWVS